MVRSACAYKMTYNEFTDAQRNTQMNTASDFRIDRDVRFDFLSDDQVGCLEKLRRNDCEFSLTTRRLSRNAPKRFSVRSQGSADSPLVQRDAISHAPFLFNVNNGERR
jgi:hypothetical protein